MPKSLVQKISFFCGIGLLSFQLLLGNEAVEEDNNSVVLQPRRPEWAHQVLSTYENGAICELLLLEKKKHPIKRLMYYASGNIKEEADLSADGKESGARVIYYEQGQLYSVARYVQGRLHGGVRYYFPSGKIALVQEWKNGLQEGIHRAFTEEGVLVSEIHYRQGEKYGDAREFYPNGKKKSYAYYLHDLLHGKKIEWNENGGLLATSYYLYGMLHHPLTAATVERYFASGAIQQRHYFSFGLPHGECVKYYENGQEQYHVQYVDGKKEGMERSFTGSGS